MRSTPSSEGGAVVQASGGRLPRVFWIGGSTFSGKSTVAAILARRFGMETMSCDDELPRHMGAAVLTEQPTLHLFGRMTELPMLMLPADLLAASLLALAREQMGMIVRELQGSDAHRPLLVEGAAVIPESLRSVPGGHDRAVWMISTDDFIREHYRAARQPLVSGTLAAYTDPERAFQGWMDRDLAFSHLVRSQVKALGLDVVEVDGTRPPEDLADEVEGRLGLGRGGAGVP